MLVQQQADFVFKLRQNISLEGDLMLAEMELKAFTCEAEITCIADMQSVLQEMPECVLFQNLARFDSHLRVSGTKAYRARAAVSLLPELIRCLSFMQAIYCVTPDTPDARACLSSIESKLGRVVVYENLNGKLAILALPHYVILELSDVVARHSIDVSDTKRNLDGLLAALRGEECKGRAGVLAEKALAAQMTTSHLSHDIHYYKAKFFPRMVRSMINVSARKLGGDSHRVIDNFAGSGTTLLEASVLGFASVGLDIDPLSAMIARAKLEVVGIDSRLLAEAASYVTEEIGKQQNAQFGLFNHTSANGAANGVINKTMNGAKDAAIVFPNWLMKNRNMTLETASNLSDAISRIQSVVKNSDSRVQNILRVLMSDAIARQIRMRFLGTGVGRFSLTFAKTPLHKVFAKSVKQYANVAATCEWLRETINLRFADAEVIHGDTRHAPDEIGTFDILVTSPPYLPASSGRESYAKARAPSLIALEMKTHENIDFLVDDSIGSMNGDRIEPGELTMEESRVVEWLQNDELRRIKAEPTAKYFLDMRRTFAEMMRLLRPGAFATVVSGKQSTFYQFSTRDALYVVPVAEMLAAEARSVGFEVEAMHDIQLKKSNMNARPRSLDDYYETLILLRRP